MRAAQHSFVKHAQLACMPLAVALLLSAAGSHAQSSGESPASAAASDGAVLLEVQTALGSANLSGWGSGSDPCTSAWQGVQCSGGRVTNLTLSASGLTGQLPQILSNLTELQVLDLANNTISGSLPAAWGAQGTFANLVVLSLARNQLTGPLPATWGQPGALPLLQLLVLNSNSLSQTLPPSWGSSYSQFTMLQVLLLDDNRLSGTLPANWSAGFANLTYMTLQMNQLSGSLPGQWAPNAFFKLQVIGLQENQLEGNLPASWTGPDAFPSVRGQLDGIVLLPGNRLSGLLPQDLPYAVYEEVGLDEYLPVTNLTSVAIPGPAPAPSLPERQPDSSPVTASAPAPAAVLQVAPEQAPAATSNSGPAPSPAGFLASQLGPLPAPAPALASASLTAQLAQAAAPLLAPSSEAPASLPAVVPVAAPLAVLPGLLSAAGALGSAAAPTPALQQELLPLAALPVALAPLALPPQQAPAFLAAPAAPAPAPTAQPLNTSTALVLPAPALYNLTTVPAPSPMSAASAPNLALTEAEQAVAPSLDLSGTAPATSPSLAPVALPTINLQGVSSLTPQAQQGVINAVAEAVGVQPSQLSLQQPGAAGPISAAALSVRSAPAGRRLMQASTPVSLQLNGATPEQAQAAQAALQNAVDSGALQRSLAGQGVDVSGVSLGNQSASPPASPQTTTASPASTVPVPAPSGGSNHLAAILGGAIGGGVALLLVVLVAVTCCVCRMRRAKAAKTVPKSAAPKPKLPPGKELKTTIVPYAQYRKERMEALKQSLGLEQDDGVPDDRRPIEGYEGARAQMQPPPVPTELAGRAAAQQVPEQQNKPKKFRRLQQPRPDLGGASGSAAPAAAVPSPDAHARPTGRAPAPPPPAPPALAAGGAAAATSRSGPSSSSSRPTYSFTQAGRKDQDPLHSASSRRRAAYGIHTQSSEDAESIADRDAALWSRESDWDQGHQNGDGGSQDGSLQQGSYIELPLDDPRMAPVPHQQQAPRLQGSRAGELPPHTSRRTVDRSEASPSQAAEATARTLWAVADANTHAQPVHPRLAALQQDVQAPGPAPSALHRDEDSPTLKKTYQRDVFGDRVPLKQRPKGRVAADEDYDHRPQLDSSSTSIFDSQQLPGHSQSQLHSTASTVSSLEPPDRLTHPASAGLAGPAGPAGPAPSGSVNQSALWSGASAGAGLAPLESAAESILKAGSGSHMRTDTPERYSGAMRSSAGSDRADSPSAQVAAAHEAVMRARAALDEPQTSGSRPGVSRVSGTRASASRPAAGPTTIKSGADRADRRAAESAGARQSRLRQASGPSPPESAAPGRTGKAVSAGRGMPAPKRRAGPLARGPSTAAPALAPGSAKRVSGAVITTPPEAGDSHRSDEGDGEPLGGQYFSQASRTSSRAQGAAELDRRGPSRETLSSFGDPPSPVSSMSSRLSNQQPVLDRHNSNPLGGPRRQA